MLAKLIFFTAVSAATLAVILLAVISPPGYNNADKDGTGPLLELSFYIQPPHHLQSTLQGMNENEAAAVFVFHHTLTAGPANTSRVIGRAQGFIIPMEHFARSAFNVIYLTFDTPHYSGSLSVEAKHANHEAREEELAVVGGTGCFAFARGLAVFTHRQGPPSQTHATYRLSLKLTLPSAQNPGPGTTTIPPYKFF